MNKPPPATPVEVHRLAELYGFIIRATRPHIDPEHKDFGPYWRIDFKVKCDGKYRLMLATHSVSKWMTAIAGWQHERLI